MEVTGVGGGIMLAIAAGLWLIYLLPNWLKRREYLATELNAVRLQQTIRVLAETAETPLPVRVDATMRRAAQGPVAVGRPVTLPLVYREDPRLLAMRRIRRGRALTTLALLVSLVVVVAQVSLMLGTGAVAGSWLVLGLALAGAVGSVSMLGRLAEAARSRTRGVEARPARRTSLGVREHIVQEPAEWTPVPVPKPLYLSRPVVERAAAAVDPTVELERAAAAAERALRAAGGDVTPIRAVPAPAPSRFASMGIVDGGAGATPDIDAVLARRRAVG